MKKRIRMISIIRCRMKLYQSDIVQFFISCPYSPRVDQNSTVTKLSAGSAIDAAPWATATVVFTADWRALVT